MITQYHQLNKMYCTQCYQKDWCICKEIHYVYNTKTIQNKCVCCIERRKAVKEFKRKIKKETRKHINKLFSKIHQKIIK